MGSTSKREEMSDDSDSSTSDILDQRNEEGWEDLEDDTEAVTVVSLFDSQTFSSAKQMLQNCKDNHDFDIWKLRKDFNLEFLELIKLVNYIRSEVKKGNAKPDISGKSRFSDEQYLQPVLEDDALLYSLDDVFDDDPIGEATSEIDQLREQLTQLKAQFQAYREEVQRSLLSDLDSAPARTSQADASDTKATVSNTAPAKSGLSSIDAGYFDSYSYNSIHELMLKDTIRTDTYRDFIYDNKHLFAGKTVLDVGCGTGILSMFCARAGAARVIAVDNSDIIHKARENVFRNKLDSTITCIRGKIEEVVLPVKQVDIIVSEWMGYCLLYESMLDSVLFARDRYLSPQGLMVPSHAVIKIAPLGDSDLRASHIDFWRDVYGFDMTAMLEKAHEEALIRTLQPRELGGEAVTVLELDLHTATVADLSFTAPFTLAWDPSSSNKLQEKKDEDAVEQHTNLEGFVLWFDTPFSSTPSPSPSTSQSQSENNSGARAPRQKTPIKPSWLNLSTSPQTTPTHWQQGVLLIESEASRLAMQQGDKVSGTIEYRKKAEEGSRGLDIEVRWNGEGKGSGGQVWSLE